MYPRSTGAIFGNRPGLGRFIEYLARRLEHLSMTVKASDADSSMERRARRLPRDSVTTSVVGSDGDCYIELFNIWIRFFLRSMRWLLAHSEPLCNHSSS